MNEVEEIEATESLGELVKIYLTIRNERERMEAEWKVKDSELKADLSALERSEEHTSELQSH